MPTNDLDVAWRKVGEAMTARRTIERATTLVMRKGRISHTEALRRLQRLQLRTRRPLMELAQAILTIEDSER